MEPPVTENTATQSPAQPEHWTATTVTPQPHQSSKEEELERQGPSRGGNGLAAAGATSRRAGKPERISKPILKPDQSKLQGDQLLAELQSLDSSDAAAVWAHRILGAKNSLTAVDAQRVE